MKDAQVIEKFHQTVLLLYYINMNLHALLRQFFTENTLMQLATVADGQPWLCNVYFVTDEEDNIYWTSARGKRRHSKEITNNPLAAATIVHDSKRKQAVQITGKAYEVSLNDAKRVDELYSAKYGDKNRLTEVMADLPDGRAYWVLKPETIELWDEVNFPNSPKQRVV